MLSGLNVEVSPGSGAPIDPNIEESASDGGKASFRAKLRRNVNFVVGLITGGARNATIRIPDKHAWGTVLFSGASGTVGAVVNGVTLTFAHGASDQVDSNTMVSTINASGNALVSNLVKASNHAMTFTLSTATVGSTILLGGVVLTGVPGTAIPTGDYNVFPVGDTDTNDATNLVTVISNHRSLRDRFVASSSSGVVTVRSLYGASDDVYTAVTGSGITRSGNFAATTTTLIWSVIKGTVGNCQTLAASGTGVTASAARLANGTLQTVISL